MKWSVGLFVCLLLLATGCTGQPHDAMLAAIRAGDVAKVKQALEQGADANYVSPQQFSALEIATTLGRREIVAVLLDAGADPNVGFVGMQTGPLYTAAELDDVEIIRMLVAAGADIDHQGGPGDTPLQHACGCGKYAAAQLLLELGADSDLRDVTCGTTTLHSAASGGSADVIELVLDASPDLINVCDEFGSSALHYAAYFGYREAVEVLLARGADPSIQDSQGSTAFDDAMSHGHADCAELLKPAEDVASPAE